MFGAGSFQNAEWSVQMGQSLSANSASPAYTIANVSETFVKHGQYLSMSDVADGPFDPGLVKGKVVMVGVYHATGIHDESLVPTRSGSQLMQGVELHANLVS